ncbi:MAG: dephospho-CoA kinase [Coriobacteriales bacterium]|jgi:dephospho-CoA kinase|nr:dephospho-CoA kinase [Coriobacteriales bacterium]
MYTVFVTGPLASGKRSACLYLALQGFSHIDADELAKEFLDDELVKAQLLEAYGTTICDDTGRINRARLAELAFATEGSSDALNGIIWPLVEARLSDLIVGNSCQFDRSEERLAVEIAMLAEAPALLDLADAVLCITADEHIRINRALDRGMRLEDVQNRMALQASDEDRARICDAVIENNGSLDQLYTKLDTWLASARQEHLF